MPKKKNRIGERYGYLTVIAKAEPYRNAKGLTTVQWKCRCDCGVEKVILVSALTNKRAPTVSCGCKRSELLSKASTTHGKSNSKNYKRWVEMIQRCTNPKNKAYHNYGGRGIKVCNRWLTSFKNFEEDMGIPEKGLTLDRINNDGDYEPSNCRWITPQEQLLNKRPSVPSKLSKKDVENIKRSKLTLKELGIKYNVSASYIGKIKRGKGPKLA